MLLIIQNIKIAFWYVTLSGNVCQLSSLNSSEDGVYKKSQFTIDILIYNVYYMFIQSSLNLFNTYLFSSFVSVMTPDWFWYLKGFLLLNLNCYWPT